MKKILRTIILAGLVLLLTVNIYAQHPLTLSWEGEPIGDTLVVYGDASEYEILAHAVVKNETNEEMDIKVARNQISLVEGTVNLFCWGLCYAPPTDTSSQHVTIPANATCGEEDYSGHYNPNEQTGTSIIEYTFYNMANPSINVKVIVLYVTEFVGIEDGDNEIQVNLFPNPTSDLLNIMAHDVKQVSIFNINGQRVWHQAFLNGPAERQIIVDCSSYINGVYFAKIETASGIITRRVVVQ